MRDILHATLVWLRLAVDRTSQDVSVSQMYANTTFSDSYTSFHATLADSSRITDIDSALAFPGPLFHEISSGDMIDYKLGQTKAQQSFINHRLQMESRRVRTSRLQSIGCRGKHFRALCNIEEI